MKRYLFYCTAGVLALAAAVAVLAMTGFRNPYQQGRLIVTLAEEPTNNVAQFISAAQVQQLIEGLEAYRYADGQLSQLNLKAVESALNAVTYIREAQVARDLTGNVLVEVRQSQPLARLISVRGQSCYLSQDFQRLPLSSRFTARVLVVNGPGATPLLQDSVLNAPEQSEFRALLLHLTQDPFWSLQIAQITLDEAGHMTFYPQAGQQTIRFGTAEQFPAKLAKLKTFYEQIIPRQGWTAYKTVDVSYWGQIVCSRQ